MIFNNLQQYFNEQNFALVTTNIPEITIFRNTQSNQGILIVLINNLSGSASPDKLKSLGQTLTSKPFPGADLSVPNDVLFLVISDYIERDKILAASVSNVWIINSGNGQLLVYENQPSDFYGLRAGIEDSAYKGAKGIDTNNHSRFERFPLVTAIIIALNIIIYLITSFNGSTSDTNFMLAAGANYGPYVFGHFQIWRLFTSMFLHFGLNHLISNMISLAVIGYTLEYSIGHLKYLLFYICSGIGAGLISAAYYYMSGTNTVSAGASGAIYGLIGVACYLTFRNFRRMKPTYIFWRIGVIIIFVFYSSFLTTGIDGAAHIGGFLFGLILSILFLRRQPNAKR